MALAAPVALSSQTTSPGLDRDFATLLGALSADERLVHMRRLPAADAITATTTRPLPDWLETRLPSLYAHQAKAIDLARAKTNVVVATSTASGKSLCYQVPIVEAAIDHGRNALAIYPTKALAHDQVRSFPALGGPELAVAAYDGDTDYDDRPGIRRSSNVIITNPEMLHQAMLPRHRAWSRFFSRLDYVVIDELHVFRGVFGSHLAHVLRRLRRLCHEHGSDPTFIFSSATIGRPGVLASALCGSPVTEVLDDAAPRAERIVALWNPPLIDADSGTRASSNVETATVLADCVSAGFRSIAFCRSRKATELVAASARRRLPAAQRHKLTSYRAGYLTDERRTIEDALFTGQVDGIVATSALELGIDIGGLDVCVLNGFPGTIASFWQQVGRVGRADRPSLAVLVAGPDQLDQWFLNHPDRLFDGAPEPAVVNPSNPFVSHPHLMCAADERPLDHGDARYWPIEHLDDAVRDLVLADQVEVRNHRAAFAGRGQPSRSIGLRSGSSDEVMISRVDGSPIGTVDLARAYEVVHPGAVYLHRGTTYSIVALDIDRRTATAERDNGETFTTTRRNTDVRILTTERQTAVGRVSLHVGQVEVTQVVTGFLRRDIATRALVESVKLDLPPSRLVTRAFWYTVDDDVLCDADIPGDALPGTLHAAEHAGIGVLPLFTICDRWDVGGVSTALLDDTAKPTVVIYDGYPGGAGIADLGFASGRRHFETTLEVIDSCECTSGCPACVQSPKCGNGNEPLDKAGAVRLLQTILS